jgi:hypothetical protein
MSCHFFQTKSSVSYLLVPGSPGVITTHFEIRKKLIKASQPGLTYANLMLHGPLLDKDNPETPKRVLCILLPGNLGTSQYRELGCICNILFASVMKAGLWM